MNKLILIGNLTRDPEMRKTATGESVCNFTLAVNKRTKSDHPEADYFRVTAWRETADNCFKYLAKGRKACVIGPVSLGSYTDRDGAVRYHLAVDAREVEFLTPKKDAQPADDVQAQKDAARGFTQVPDEEVPDF